MCAYCNDKGTMKLGKKAAICPFCKGNKSASVKTPTTKTARSKGKNKTTNDILRDTIHLLAERNNYLASSIETNELTAKTSWEKQQYSRKTRNEMQFNSAVSSTLKNLAAWIG